MKKCFLSWFRSDVLLGEKTEVRPKGWILFQINLNQKTKINQSGTGNATAFLSEKTAAKSEVAASCQPVTTCTKAAICPFRAD